MKVANAVAKILKKEGVEFLIGYPVNQIIEAAAEEDIRTIIVRQERVGLHMADAVSRTSSGQRIGVFAMQHGPGTENAFGGVAQAFGDSVPIVVLPGGYPRKILNITPNFSSLLNFQHVTKWCEQVVLPDSIPDAMRRAFTQVKNGRPRPVMVEIPVDVMRADISDDLVTRTFSRAFRMAGLRLGYLLADPAVVDGVRLVRLPYHLSALTQAVGLRALRHKGVLMSHVVATERERERVAAALDRLPGVRVLPSDANFLCFETPVDPRPLWRGLLERGVLVRDVSGYPTLERFLRVTIGTPAEDDAFLTALTEELRQ